MKKVLIIGHFWPYKREGSCRLLGLAKWLKEFGWQPIIITGPLNSKPNFDVRYVEIDYRSFLGFRTKKNILGQMQNKAKELSPKQKSFLKFIYNRLREIFAYPDEDKYWKKPVLKEANKIIKSEKIDAIISVWPLTSHVVAKELKNKYGIFWIADFPELWTQNCDYVYSRIRKFFERKLELKTLSSADILTTISKPMANELKELHKRKIVYTITHGFDPEEVNSPAVKLTPKFTITYTGQMYAGKRDPFKILIALKSLISNGIIDPEDIEIRFYGPQYNELEEEIKKQKLSSIVRQYGLINREFSLLKQKESQLLLLLNWEDENQKGVYTGKIFEYLAAKRPIIATGGFGNDVVEELLKETKAGVYASGVDDIKKHLTAFYSEYKKMGRVDFKGDIEKINKYNHREMAKKFSVVLNRFYEK